MSASAASSAPPPAAIYDSDGPPAQDQELVSVFPVPVDDIDGNDATDDNGSGDEGDETEDAVFFRAARDIMNRTARNIGSAAMEDRRFRSFFGARYDIVKMVWEMLGEGGLRPEKCEPKHLLWALYFLKVYPREAPGCAAVGGSKGAIDPKTMRKWVWLMLERIADLADIVVSACSCSFFPRFHLTSFFRPPISRNHRSCLRVDSTTTKATIVL